MNGLKKLNDLLFPGAKTYERVGAGKAVALGFQHAFAMSCATILVPLLTGLDVGVALLAIVGGLKVNTDLQVLTAEKQPIEGLYAIGNASGDLYAIDYPINMAGNSNGRALTWGYLIGDILSK